MARHPGRAASGVQQPFGHQGLLYEPEIGQYQNRARQYDPGKRRFGQRDPLSFLTPVFAAEPYYQDGMSLYQYVDENPLVRSDPLGTYTFAGRCICCYGKGYWARTVTFTTGYNCGSPPEKLLKLRA